MNSTISTLIILLLSIYSASAFWIFDSWSQWFHKIISGNSQATSESSLRYSEEEGNICVKLAAAAYCDMKTYASWIQLEEPVHGFSLTGMIISSTDTVGYIGIIPSTSSIYVVFRGSHSLKNKISDADSVKVPYTSYSDCQCEVHKGFYTAEQNVIGDIIEQVQMLLSTYPDFTVKVTGHSLGAAMALLTAMDLLRNNIDAVVYSFGQPRIGDNDFAAFVNNKLVTWRVTHNKDMVPHLPPILMGFEHTCTEVFEDSTGRLKTCSSNECEDPDCANQFYLDLNMDDHYRYLGVAMECPK